MPAARTPLPTEVRQTVLELLVAMTRAVDAAALTVLVLMLGFWGLTGLVGDAAFPWVGLFALLPLVAAGIALRGCDEDLHKR